MEPIFETHYTFTRENVKKASHLGNRRTLIILSVLAAFCAVNAVLLIVSPKRHPSDDVGIYIFLFLGLISLAAAYSIATSWKLNYKRILVNNNGQEPENIFCFYENHIEITDPATGNKNTFSYALIRRFLESRNLYVLMLDGKQYLPLEKARFTVGDPGQLRAFLARRTPRVKAK